MTPEMMPVVVGLADEGVPIAAIARSVKRQPELVRDALKEALDDGLITLMPAEDWPKNTKRDSRTPAYMTTKTEEDVAKICVRVFKMTPTEAKVFVPLIARGTVVRREALLRSINGTRPESEECDMKMVDVMIHKLRRKLVQFDIEIITVWSQGYQISDDHRKIAFDLLSEPV